MLRPVALARLLVPLAAGAQRPAPWDVSFAATPAQLRDAAASIRVPPGADVDVLLDETTVSWDEAGRESRVSRLVYRVHTPNGVQQWGGTSAAWSPWHDNRPGVRVRVIDPSGREFRLDPATLSEGPAQPAAMTYSDGRVLRGPFPGLTPGSLVEEEVSWSEHTPFFDAGVAGRLLLERGVRAETTRIRLEAPTSIPLRYELRAKDVEVKTFERDGRRVIELTRGPSQREPQPIESSGPDAVLPIPHVEYSTGSSWQAVAARYHQRVEERIGKTDRKVIAQSLTKGAKNRTETAHRVLAWVQDHVRYTGLQLGEASIIPATPEETLDRGFGDCKDLSTVTVALLRAAGIPANVALLRTQTGEISDGLAGLGLVDHAIVQIPAAKGQPELWMDPTVPTLPAGELPASLQGRPALVAHPSTRKLTRLPQSSSSDNVVVTSREWRLAEWGAARVVEARHATGAFAEQYRSTVRSGREETEQMLRDFTGKFYLSEVIEKVEHTPVADMARPFELRFEIPEARVLDTGWSDVAAQLPRSLVFSWIPNELKPDADGEEDVLPRRVTDVVLGFPHRAEMRHTLVPPPGFKVQLPLPADETLQLGPAKYDVRYTLEKNGSVVAHFRLDSVKRRYSPSEAEAFRKAYTALFERGMPEVRFHHEPARLIEEGRIREALAQYRQRIQDAPKSAIAHTRYAGALIDLGFGDAAREEAKRASLIGSDEVINWLTLGWVRSRDLFGREFGRGYDRPGAIEALKSAVELAPDNGDIRMRLARVYERNADGEAYEKGAELARAIAEYAHAVDALKAADAEVPLAAALFAAERYDDLIARAPKMAETPQRNTFWLAALAMKQGEAAAIGEANRRIRDLGQRRQALAEASKLVAGLRRYPAAAALLREGTKGSADSRQLEALSMLEKLRPYDQVKLPPSDPRAAIIAMFRPMLERKGRFTDAFAARIREEFEQEEPAKVFAAFSASFRHVPAEIMRTGVDAIASAMPLAPEGDAKTGYRVRISNAFTPDTPTFFVLVENGKARVLATSDQPELVAGEAFIAAQRGDLATARRWLEWTRELVTVGESPVVREFHRVWPRGHQGTKEELLYASALISGRGFDADRVLPYLREQEKKATPERRSALWVALAQGHLEEKQFDAALPWADKFLAAHPDSLEGFWMKQAALGKSATCEARSAVARARLAAVPNDGIATGLLADCAVKQGDLKGAVARLEAVVETQQARSSDYNNLAWFSMTAGRVDQTVIDWALRAVSMEKERGGASLNTAACVYARAGKGGEAMQFLLKSMQAGQDESSATWFAAGLIAEDFGLPEEALRFYGRVEKSNGDERPDSAWSLTQARRAELEEAGKAPVTRTGSP
ncbi:MAG: DUF3857 domain-containing protein [Myxococcaceae bacterium]